MTDRSELQYQPIDLDAWERDVHAELAQMELDAQIRLNQLARSLEYRRTGIGYYVNSDGRLRIVTTFRPFVLNGVHAYA